MNKKYSINDIIEIHNKGFYYKIDKDTINNILDLYNKLNKPISINDNITFIKNNNKQQQYYIKKNNKYNKDINEKWETQPQFISTKIIKKQGIELYINDIRNNLNKLTDNNYENILIKVIEIIDNILIENNGEEILHKISNIIFELATNNKFYSKIYAKLYSELINKYNFMKNIFNIIFNEYYEIFKNIEYITDDKDYDLFCKINKINENRKSISLFLLNLCKNNVLTKDKLFNIIVKLMNDILILINIPNKINEVNEIIENFIILFDIEYFDDYKDNIIFEDKSILDKIIELANSKNKQYISFSIKNKFKFMSLIGE